MKAEAATVPVAPLRAAELDVVRRAADGCPRSFERIYRAHAPRIYSLCARMLGDDEADEMCQRVFVLCWRKLDRFEGRAAFGTWLYRLAVNAILSRRRELGTRRGREEENEAALENAVARPPSSDLNMDFEGALSTLPEGCRQVFVLHDVEGYKHEEIAGMLDITAGTSKSQLHRARMLLRRHLGH
jgi:RNA polymerase sigma-70 factor (ECF subfamily)